MERKFNKQSKLHLRKGDSVKVIAGKSKDKTGKILRVLLKERRAVVENLNMITKHIKPNANKPEGGVVKIEAPIHISNLMLLDPKTQEPTRIGRKIVEGKLKRYSKKTGEIIEDNE